MTVENILETLSILSPLLPALISAVVSYAVASLKAKSEIKKVLLQLSHKDKQNLQNTFSVLITNIDEYCFSNCQLNKANLIKSVSAFLCMANDDIKPLLIELNEAIEAYNISELMHLKNEIIILYSSSQQNSN